MTKLEMAAAMIKGAIAKGFHDVTYLLADVWFGDKTMSKVAEKIAYNVVNLLCKNFSNPVIQSSYEPKNISAN